MMDDRFDYDPVFYFYHYKTLAVIGTLTSDTHSLEEISILVSDIANTKEVTLMMNARDRTKRILEKLEEKGVKYDFKMRLGQEV